MAPFLQDYLQSITAGVVHNARSLAEVGWLSSCTNRAGWLFLLWFTNMPLRSTDQQLAFRVLYFSVWYAVSLRISVQTASLWQRVRWVASDTTSQTTHQTNLLKALSTLSLYHLICLNRDCIDISIILQLSVNKYSPSVVSSHINALHCPHCSVHYLHKASHFLKHECLSALVVTCFLHFSTCLLIRDRRSQAADFIPLSTLVVLRIK